MKARKTKLKNVTIRNGIAVRLDYDCGDVCRYSARARSQRQADKVARKLNWFSFSDGVGQPYARLDYWNGRLTYVMGWDI